MQLAGYLVSLVAFSFNLYGPKLLDPSNAFQRLGKYSTAKEIGFLEGHKEPNRPQDFLMLGEISPRGQSREFNAYITTLPSYERSKVIANYPVRIAKGQVFEIHATHAATAELFRYGWLGAWAKHAAIESKTCRDR